MVFKKNKVWLATDRDQKPVTKNGKVLIRYQLDQDYEYWVLSKNINPSILYKERKKPKKEKNQPKNRQNKRTRKQNPIRNFWLKHLVMMPSISTQTEHLQETPVHRESAWFCALANMKKRYQNISVLPPTTWQNSKPSDRVLWL